MFLHLDDELLIDRAAKALAQYYLGKTNGSYVAMLKEEIYSRHPLRDWSGQTISPLVWEIIKTRAKVIQEDIESKSEV